MNGNREMGMATNWTGCYDGGWQGLIVPDAFAHPAKFSRQLIARIYQHVTDEGWVQPGSVVLDPFGGVALGACDALRLGLNWVGVELEPKFVGLAGQNIDLWTQRFGHVRGFGSARILQGDSRELAVVLQNAELEVAAKTKADLTEGPALLVSSPPYAESIHGSGAEAAKKRIAEGRYRGVRPDVWTSPGNKAGSTYGDGYGETPGNLGNMRPGDVNAVIASPPYANGLGKEDTYRDQSKREKDSHRGIMREKGIVDPFYGQTPGQLGAMRVSGVIGSPPWEQSGVADHEGQTDALKGGKFKGGGDRFLSGNYGTSNGNVGNSTGDDFWTAARTILEQVYLVLAPGGHAVWVCKSFVRKGKVVDFPAQWAALCESVGFKHVCSHRAWLVSDHGEQGGLFGDSKRLRRERKSFFRRLAESKGSPRIDFEMVDCFVKETP